MTALTTKTIAVGLALSLALAACHHKPTDVPAAPDYADSASWFVVDRSADVDLFYITSTETDDYTIDGTTMHFADPSRDSIRALLLDVHTRDSLPVVERAVYLDRPIGHYRRLDDAASFPRAALRLQFGAVDAHFVEVRLRDCELERRYGPQRAEAEKTQDLRSARHEDGS